MSRPRRALTFWLQHEASRSADPGALLAGLCQRLVEADLPLRAAALTISTLHPLVAGSTFTWQRDRAGCARDAALSRHARRASAGAAGRRHATARSGDRVQRRRPPHAGAGDRSAGRLRSRAAARSCGASPACWRRRSRSWSPGRPPRPCSTTYLGRRSGTRVLAGAVQRGDGETIHAVLWYSDLRGFTALSESLPRDRVIAPAERPFRAARRADQGVRRRGAEVHGRRPAGDLSDRAGRRRPGVRSGAARPRAARAPAWRRSTASAWPRARARSPSAWRCIWATSCTAISARPTGSTSR